MPFVDKDKTLYGTDISNLESAPETIYYIGNGCFLYRNIYNWGWSGVTYEEVIYNAENKKYYELSEDDEKGSDHPTCIEYEYKEMVEKELVYDNGTNVNVTNDEYVIWQAIGYDRGDYEITLLNTTTMQPKIIYLDRDEFGLETKYYPISEGMFAVTSVGRSIFKFFDLSGNLVLDLSSYDLTHKEQKLFFKNGKCTFTIYNNSDNIYEITINKKGKVIDSVEK